MTKKMWIFLIASVTIMKVSSFQISYDCPEDWYTYDAHCYKFQGDVTETYDGARFKCNMHGAGVLSVAGVEENLFIIQWLQRNDPFRRDWYTSGVLDMGEQDLESGARFVWESTGEIVDSSLASLWLEELDLPLSSGVIVYTFGDSGLRWLFTGQSKKRPYICKISQQEAYRILTTSRGFDYGSEEESIHELEMGPHFLRHPESTVVVSEADKDSEPVHLECQAQANPPATYRWFKGRDSKTEITEALDIRYTIIGGKLIIDRPIEEVDSDIYYCAAQNKFGSVISNIAEISFGNLGDFSNVQDAGSRAKAYDGATLECSNIQFKPGISYQWMKGDSQQFVRTKFQDYIFISRSGKLYFSEVSESDEDEYRCVVTLTGADRYVIGTDQPPMRTSLPIPLIVDDQAPKVDWGPEIQNDFIAVFPRTPLRGQDVRLECFAYGSSTSAFFYSWSRDDKPMPKFSHVRDHGRVLVLRDAQLEDSGIYRCTVSRGAQASDSKTIQLNLEAQPYFVSPLADQHADINSQITWICNARGKPDPIYHWYKNGEKLTTQQDAHIMVQRNVLIIKKLDPDLHNGMYQCGAENSHGLSRSNAQLRVLAFAPTLTKFPPPSSLLAPEQGNVTLRCHPEGSPLPDIQWLKDGSQISDDESKFTVLTSGNLQIKFLSADDSGSYTCLASNTYGETNATVTVEVTQGATITLPPSDVTTTVNRTVFLVCEASYPVGIELVYEWTFNGFPLDFNDGVYRQVQGGQSGTNGLYIISAQFDHEGLYTCTARTPFSAYSRSAYLTVNGPPRQPAGVSALSETATQNATVVLWTQGSSSGGTISAHVIQVSNEFEPEVWRDLLTVNVGDSYNGDDHTEGKHSSIVTGLNPRTGYQFRVIAENEYGRGVPSDPSPYVQTLSAPPSTWPKNLRGGGGSVGDLTIRWDPLHRSEYGAKSVGYYIYWRKKDVNAIDGLFTRETVLHAEKDFVVRQVGVDNYYILYEVKIQAFNEMGTGPNSSVAEVYSAEDLPIAVPENVKTSTYNSTAIEVFWDSVPTDRKSIRGKIVGYQINYWDEEHDPDIYMRSIRYYGQVNYGLVIGLVENLNWIVDVQVYNSGGLGPRSNQYIMETSGYAPLTYPQEVHVTSAGESRARLWWRGVSLTVSEEALVGYAIWLWTASEDFRSAELIEVPGRGTSYVLKSIKPHRLYALRIAAVGGGGFGRKTPTVYFTTEGEILIDRQLAETVDAFIALGFKERYSIMWTLLCCLFSYVIGCCF